MNRLTNYKQGRRREPSKKLVETKYMPCSKCDYIYCDECVFQIHTNRLAAYEDTGLEPEEVRQLNDAFKNSQKKLEKAFDDLLEYKKLEEQGLLIKLPCKPYTIVYEVQTEHDSKNDKYIKIIKEWLVLRFGINQYCNYAMLKNDDEDLVTLGQFGKTVFLTREDAGKALKGAEDEL